MFKVIKNLLMNKSYKQKEESKKVQPAKPVTDKGRFDLFGATVFNEGIVFTVYVKDAKKVALALFEKNQKKPKRIIAFPNDCKLGDVYSMLVKDLKAGTFEYMFIKNETEYFLDPYAKEVSYCKYAGSENQWRKKQYRGRVIQSQFDWQGVKNPNIPMCDLIIYETHVGGYTKNGTFTDLMEKIPYLVDLGINAVELLPIFSFDAEMDIRYHGGQKLGDYWGYNPINFFSPNRKYYNESLDELKKLVRELHRNGIEVILDVVYNHTAEGGKGGYPINYKISDKRSHYILGSTDTYHNYSGCGNTLNCNNPIVKKIITDSVKYWVSEYHIDGFRFDLASILTRGEFGQELSDPPVVKELALDPTLKGTKLIAEAWDTGLYQVGKFPSYGKWVEWNGKYRDAMRRFLKGDDDIAYEVIERFNGSLDIYNEKIRKDASVNFITCHDGFTLHDLYSFNMKHNEANGWDNTDGEGNNHSWNCGVEGETKEKKVLELRKKMVKNAIMALLSSRGVPMMLAGDEFGRTQLGNNNAYCQDNAISWVDWSLLSKNKELFEFTKKMIELRKAHPIMKRRGKPAQSGQFYSISHHGIAAWNLGNPNDHKFLGIMFTGRNSEDTEDDYVYVAMNVRHLGNIVELPRLPDDYRWTLALSSDNVKMKQMGILLPERTVAIFVSKRIDAELLRLIFNSIRKKRNNKKRNKGKQKTRK